MEDLAGEKEMREQLKFENLVPKEKETPEIIPILPGELQPRKVEEAIPDDDIQPDTYIIYPTGGYHPFYGVPNTFPRYQLPIWPRVVRIKFSESFKSQATVDKVRGSSLKEHQTINQINPCWNKDYYRINLDKSSRYTRHHYKVIRKNGKVARSKAHSNKNISNHRLIALAFIPNPENKPLVLHINDDSTNNLIENLKWGTQRENMKGKTRIRPDTMEQKYLALVDRGIIKG